MTLNGVFSNLKDNLASFFNEVAELGVLDELKLLIAEINDEVGGRGGLAQALADLMVRAIRSVRRAIEAGLIDALSRLFDLFAKITEAIGALAGDTLDGQIQKIENLTDAFISVTNAALPMIRMSREL